MPSNLAIDDRLLEKAKRIGKQRTKRATVNEALREYIQRHMQMRALEGFGTFDFDPKYDYKAARRKR